MSKNKNEATKTGILDIRGFEQAIAQDTFSMASLILKIRESGVFPSLSDWIKKYPIPQGTIPCPESAVKCMVRLTKMMKTDTKTLHPTHHLDVVVASHDVVVAPTGVTYVDDKDSKKTLEVSMGYLMENVENSLRIIHANTADVVATDAKCDKQGNVVPPQWPDKLAVPLSNSSVVRVYTQSTTSSKAKARDEIFTFLMHPKNIIFGVRLHSAMAKTLDHYQEHDGLTKKLNEYYDKSKIPRPTDPVRVIATNNGDLLYSDRIQLAYKYYFKSLSIRGSRKGKSITHGFEMFSMSKTMANNLALVRDFINMSEEFETKTVLIKDSTYLTTEQIRVLIFNGFRVVSLNSIAPKCYSKSPPGFYSSYDVCVKLFEFMVMPDSQVQPKLSNDLITMGKYYDDALTKFALVEKGFTYAYLDTRLKARTRLLSLLPSAAPDNMQIIIARGANTTYTLEKHIKRCTMAISCRNLWLINRKPFFTVDIMGSFVKWRREILYPAIHTPKEEKVLDLLSAKVGDNMPKHEPLKINMDNFQSIVDEEDPQEMTEDILWREMLDDYNDTFFRAYIGNEQGNVYLYLKADERLPDRFSSLLNMPRKEVEGRLRLVVGAEFYQDFMGLTRDLAPMVSPGEGGDEAADEGGQDELEAEVVVEEFDASNLEDLFSLDLTKN